MVRCPLCDSVGVHRSGCLLVVFEDRRYEYVDCRSCGSLFCDPMPDPAVLARLYGPEYSRAGEGAAAIRDPKEPERLLAALVRRPPGLFVDFGCGSGSLLRKAGSLGWNSIGVEFSPAVARGAAEATGCNVVHGVGGLRSSPGLPADVIHLGDVVEHLTAPDRVLGDLVDALAVGGWLVAQGPLEAGPCLFALTIHTLVRMRRSRMITQPPYHVLQATVRGQLALFERVGLTTLEYRVSEVAWPAPYRLSREVLRRPRSLGLFGLRRLSQMISAFSPSRLGNRYFYIGLKTR